MSSPSDIVLVHSSDLHIDHQYGPEIYGGVATMGLRVVLGAAAALDADAVLVAGDMFENNRLPEAVLEETAQLLAAATAQVVILPGNHDPAMQGSAHERGGLGEWLLDPAAVGVMAHLAFVQGGGSPHWFCANPLVK